MFLKAHQTHQITKLSHLPKVDLPFVPPLTLPSTIVGATKHPNLDNSDPTTTRLAPKSQTLNLEFGCPIRTLDPTLDV
jgi:hypothetical protein